MMSYQHHQRVSKTIDWYLKIQSEIFSQENWNRANVFQGNFLSRKQRLLVTFAFHIGRYTYAVNKDLVSKIHKQFSQMLLERVVLFVIYTKLNLVVYQGGYNILKVYCRDNIRVLEKYGIPKFELLRAYVLMYGFLRAYR